MAEKREDVGPGEGELQVTFSVVETALEKTEDGRVRACPTTLKEDIG